MLLLNYRPDITGGAENVIAILFDMNKLWEEFVYRRLKKEEANFNILVNRQQSESFWDSDMLYNPKTIRPDIVIHTKTETIVLDTKWKIIDDLIPADADLKQMFVYNLFWGCNRSILLYPSLTDRQSVGDYFDFNEKGKMKSKCRIQTMSILHNGKLNADFGTQLAALLVNSNTGTEKNS